MTHDITTYSSLERRIAKMYILLLPIRMVSPLGKIVGVVGACATYFDFILHIIGFLLMLLNKNGKLVTTKNANMFIKLILLFEVISVVMAVVLNEKLGTINGEGTVEAISGPFIYYIHYIFIIYYNIHVFRILTFEEIEKLLNKVVNFLMILGYAQIGVCVGVGFIGVLYDAIDVFDVFRDAVYITTISRIPLSGSEPAAAGCVIGLFVLPFLLSKIVREANKKKMIMNILLWLPIIYFTKSSTCFLLVFCNMAIFIYFFIKYNRRSKGVIVLMMIIMILALTTVFLSSNMMGDNEVVNNIRYLLFEKASDGTNESTVTRTIPTHINFSIFKEYPILGVGNGNQGFFYKKYFPSWGEISSNTFGKIQGVADGGVFIPSLFSGYGIVGILAFAICIARYINRIVHQKHKLGHYYFMFFIALIAFLINGFQGDYFGNYLVLFVLCMPAMDHECNAFRVNS